MTPTANVKRPVDPVLSLKAKAGQAKAAVRREKFLALCAVNGLPAPACEFRFHDTRKWKFDFAWPQYKLALESEGGGFMQGRHARGAGMRGDIEKYNAAALDGWMVLRVLSDVLCRDETIQLVRRAFQVPR